MAGSQNIKPVFVRRCLHQPINYKGPIIRSFFAHLLQAIFVLHARFEARFDTLLPQRLSRGTRKSRRNIGVP